MRTTRISRTVELPMWSPSADRFAVPGGEFVISVDLPPSADRFDVADAVVELDRIAPLVEGMCPSCGTARDTVHRPECSFTFDDQIERCRREAVEEGMAP